MKTTEKANKGQLGYELYAGNQSEKTTVIDAVEKLKRKYGIGKLTFVADTGMHIKEHFAVRRYLSFALLKHFSALVAASGFATE